jgi:glycyl-tRNA synthetase
LYCSKKLKKFVRLLHLINMGDKPKKGGSKSVDTLLDTLMEIAGRRGFLNPTAEIYASRISGFYDYGPLGFLLRTNIIELWRDIFVRKAADPPIYEIYGSVVLPEDVLIASGHAKSFNDPIVNCTNKKCNAVHRADHLIEKELGRSVEALTVDQLNALLSEHGIKCPDCGEALDPIQTFNLMLKLQVGPLKNAKTAYLRPETAQTIFMNFRSVMNSMRAKIPFGIAQVGHSYRNEISPRQGLIRLREFSQMEIETFIDPATIQNHPAIDDVKDIPICFIPQKEQLEAEEKGTPTPEGKDAKIGDLLATGQIINQYLAYYMGKEEIFYRSLGVPHESIRFRHMTPAETPFYSKGNYDVEVKLSIGWKEVIGNAYRTDHDLTTHQKHSGTKLEYHEENLTLIPHNIEPSFGVERAFYCTMEHAYRPEKFDRDWAWFKFPAPLAPYKVHIYPLMKKPELADPAYQLYLQFKKEGMSVLYDKAGAIGKRYARADEIGTPYCVTLDYETIEKQPSTVTIRDRDSMEQIRVPAADAIGIIKRLIAGSLKFLEAGTQVNTRTK